MGLPRRESPGENGDFTCSRVTRNFPFCTSTGSLPTFWVGIVRWQTCLLTIPPAASSILLYNSVLSPLPDLMAHRASSALHNGPWLCQRYFCEQQQDRAVEVCSTAGEGCPQIRLLLSRVCPAS